MSTLRNATIRLAFENPEMREHLVPLLMKQARPLVDENPTQDVLKYGHDALTSSVRSLGDPWWKVTTGMYHSNGGKPKFTWTVSDGKETLFTVSAIRYSTVTFSRRDYFDDYATMIPTKWAWGIQDFQTSKVLGMSEGDMPKIPSRNLKMYITDRFGLNSSNRY